MSDEQAGATSTSEEEKPKTNEVTVGPIEVAVTVTVKSPDPGGPLDPPAQGRSAAEEALENQGGLVA